MATTILSQLRAMRKQIHIPYRIEFVSREIKKEEFKEKVIYIHICI